jgi:hypothetical protein
MVPLFDDLRKKAFKKPNVVPLILNVVYGLEVLIFWDVYN